MKQYAVPDFTTAEEIKEVRKSLGLTQSEFAKMIGCSRPTMERWERSKEPIKGPMALLIYMMQKDLHEVKSFIVPDRLYPLRLWYMYKQKPCTLIDVDEMRQKVQIRNFTDHLLFRAFGNNLQPSFEDYKEFLESRCFPKERDKMKLVLKDLGLLFYDPLMIIEKTEGRMAEDDFWIRIDND